ncbi:MAG: hypothetical protein LBD08_06725 [Treponema sp.]|nr:hypothetical protein [Treponema sp.]
MWIINYWDFAIFIVYLAFYYLVTENKQPENKNQQSETNNRKTRTSTRQNHPARFYFIYPQLRGGYSPTIKTRPLKTREQIMDWLFGTFIVFYRLPALSPIRI